MPIGALHVGVADDLDLPAIVMREQAEKQLPDGVGAEVGRDVADSQSSVGRAVVLVGANLCGERLGEPPGPAAMLGQERLGIVVGMRMQVEEEVARDPGVVGLQFRGLAKHAECLIEAALILKHVAQVVVGLGTIGLQLDGTLEGRDGLVETTLLPQDIAHLDVRLVILGLKLDGTAAHLRTPRRDNPFSRKTLPRLR